MQVRGVRLRRRVSRLTPHPRRSNEVNENFEIDSSNVYDKYMLIMDAGIPILHQSGDIDLAVPSLGTQACMLNLNLTTSADWAPWSVDGSKQVAGYSQSWNDGLLTFATVKGAGHQTPVRSHSPSRPSAATDTTLRHRRTSPSKPASSSRISSPASKNDHIHTALVGAPYTDDDSVLGLPLRCWR